MWPRFFHELVEREKVVGILKAYLGHQSKIVVVSAMQALAELAQQYVPIRKEALDIIRKLTRTGSPAMRARGKKLLRQLEAHLPG